VESLTLRYHLNGLEILHTYATQTGDPAGVNRFCYYQDPGVSVHNSILMLLNSTECPMMVNVQPLFHDTVISTGILTIICVALMIMWLLYRSTLNGIKRLFRNQCCTQSVSLLLTVLIVGFSIPGFAIIVDQFWPAVYNDFGKTFWGSWGCTSYYSDGYVSCSGNCLGLPNSYDCNSQWSYDTGMVIAYVNLAMYVILCIYSWIGSWCCSCCCPGVEYEVFPTTTTSVHYTNPNAICPLGEYVLYVHHGAQFPTKVVVKASTLDDLNSGIRECLQITAPFKVAVFDEVCQQYVLVTTLQLIPPQATVQLLFN